MCACLYAIAWLAMPAYAHHGRDFLMTQSAHLPETGQIYGIARQDFVDEGDEKEWEFEPAIIGSITDWLTLEVHGHLEKVQGESTEYESTAVASHFRFTPRKSAWALGAAVEYEIARHEHEVDIWEIAGVASYEKDAWMLGINLLAERAATGGAETEWGYAVGIRRELQGSVAIGLEVAGSFEEEKEGEVLVGMFADPTPWLTVNVGIGTGFNEGPDVSFRSAFVFRFR